MRSEWEHVETPEGGPFLCRWADPVVRTTDYLVDVPSIKQPLVEMFVRTLLPPPPLPRLSALSRDSHPVVRERRNER